MRTLPPTNPPSGSLRASRPSRKGAALGILLATLVAGGSLGAAAGDPGAVARWASRAVIRARGGAFVSFPGAVLQSGPADCGPAALATLLRTLGGNPPSPDSLRVLAGTGARGTTLGGLARAARLLGVPAELRRLDAAAMQKLSSPVVAWVDRGHFVTVVPDSGHVVFVLDPEAGPYRIDAARLPRFWSGEALVPEPARGSAGGHPSNATTGEVP